MSKVLVNESSLTAIGDAIRAKNGTQNTYRPSEMAAAIDDISVAGGDDALKALIERTLTKIEIPRGVSVIGSGAFSGCDQISGKVTVPEGVTAIREDAFRDCDSITELDLPDSLVELGRQCFMNMDSLEKLVLPKNVTAIPVTMASQCGMTGFTALGDIKTISGYALQYCSRCLTYDFTACTSVPTLHQTSVFIDINPGALIYVPASLYSEWIAATNWAEYADYIVGIGIGGELEYSLNENSYTVTGIGTYINTDGDGTKLVIPSEHNGLPVTVIETDAFGGAEDIVSVSIPETVTSIGAAAFSGCTNLAYAYIPESVTSIGASAFSGCTNLAYAYIPESVTSIGAAAFADCSNLTEIYFGAAKMADCASSDGVFARAGASGDGISVVIGKEVEKIPTYLFYGGYPSGSYSSKVTSVEFEEGSVCAEIGDGAFHYCLYLEEFKAPATLEQIGIASLFHVEVLDFSACTQVPVLTDDYAWSVTAIYVPAALYDQWIVATNWAQYANKIVAK